MGAVSLPLAFASLGALFVVSLVGALTPLVLARKLQSQEFFRLADSFAAGVLTSAAFVHLFPDAQRALDAALHTSYPVAGAFALCGASAMYVIDACASVRSTLNTGYVLAGALSLHALLEGLALGASALRSHTFTAILLAILLHKAFAALSLGAALMGSGVPRRICIAIAVSFAAVTPVAALLALTFVQTAFQPDASSAVSAALTAISSGIFAYIAFAELLQSRPVPDASTCVSHSPIPSPCVYGAFEAAPAAAHTPNGSAAKAFETIIECDYVPQREAIAKRPNEMARAAVFLAAAAVMALLAIWT